ncbi:phosphoribosylformylglycinamidine (FGAM) synthase-like amidotransferase family enzyme [Limimaricola variabilis]|uniref:Phosphoribosylformylglycinamidine (FGAM) synthase-like amidotransferase family enzyme n=1 Tax=Limimaricola variabilis TaxID=1492771 RepID=A0ABR6HMS5_9RHOB|nr:phosphoribosylformylglycinamidine (FGAM) synthase-like amidotransferase family enzyme [Limimaricola variabilis]
MVKVRRNAPFITVDMNEDSTYTVAVSANDGIAFVRTADAESAQKLKSLLAKS